MCENEELDQVESFKYRTSDSRLMLDYVCVINFCIIIIIIIIIIT